MSPPQIPFLEEQLPERIQYNAAGKKRKPELDLNDCKLQSLDQYNCNVIQEGKTKGYVNCEVIERLFRRCSNGLTVEVTKLQN